MFGATFRNTVKTLLRSVTFWLVFAVFAVILVYYGIQQGFTSHYVEIPGFTPPEQLSFFSYAQEIDNLVHAGSTLYPLAILVVITTVLVLNRDYGDQFYEIEKAAGAKPLQYLFGRLCAIVTVTFAVQWVLSLGVLQLCVLPQGGVEGLSPLQYVGESLFRLTRINLCTALPHILFYVGLTYLLGTLFRNGIVAASGGFISAIAFFVIYTMYRHEMWAETYISYLSPMPVKLRSYFAYVGLENEETMFGYFGTSLGKAMLGLAFLVGVFAVCSAVAYALLRKRET